jgi:colanic acid/amylovoran biosynthesis glycosyltransferase
VRDEAGNVDGLPNVAMEALASGTPLVATPAGGIGDVATHDRTALLVPERDADALARAIETLLRDPERRRALGERARADVGAAYDWSRIVARFEALYDRAREMEHRRLEATARAGPGR